MTTVTGGKLDPAKNRVRTSNSLQGNAMWQSVIGVSAEAQAGNNAAVEKLIAAPQTKPSRTNQKQSRQEAAAEAMKMTSNFDTGLTDYESLLSLAKSQGCLGNEKRGACKICGQVGHLTKQCRNQFSKFYEGDDRQGVTGKDAAGGYALVREDDGDGDRPDGKDGKDGRDGRDGYGSDGSLSSLSSFDEGKEEKDKERKKRKKAKKEKKRKEKEKKKKRRSS